MSESNFYNTVHLKDYDTIEEATNVVKSMVSPNLAKYITVDLVRSAYLDPKKREYRLSTLVNYFSNRAKAVKDIEKLESWTGMIVGGRDIRKYNQAVEEAKAQTHIMVLENGEVRSFSTFGHKIGGGDYATNVPTLQRTVVKVNLYKETSYGKRYSGKMLVSSEPMSDSEVVQYLLPKVMSAANLTSEMKYQPVLLRGKIDSIRPLENWVETDQVVPVTDAAGNQVFEMDENNKLILDKEGNPVPKYRFKQESDGIGQPLIQLKGDNSNTQQYVFKILLHDEDVEGVNISVQFQRTKLADKIIKFNDVDILMNDAMKAPAGGSEDGLSMLNAMWRGLEVIVAGSIISVKDFINRNGEKRTWYGIDGTLVIPVTIVEDNTGNNTTVVTPTPTTTTEQVPDAVVIPNKPEPPTIEARTVEEKPPVPPVVTSAPVVSPPTKSEFDPLVEAINTIFDVMGTDVSYDAAMNSSFKNVIPENFRAQHQKPIVEAFMDKVRNDRRAAAAPSPATSPPVPPQSEPSPPAPSVSAVPTPPPSSPAPTPQPTPPAVENSTPPVENLLAAQMSAAPEDVVKDVISSTAKPAGEGVICGKCGKALSDDEIMTHVC